jgi:hypothetical protein
MSEEFVEQKKRPDMVTGLGIMSFVNCGLFLIVYLVALMGVSGLNSIPEDELQAQLDEAFEQMAGTVSEADVEQVYVVLDVLKEKGVMIMAVLLVLTALRLFGVMKMWKNQKQGFHIYAGGQVARVLAPILFFGSLGVSVFGSILAVLMIVGYGTQMKHMH